jgi:hypothetical protein
MAKSDHGKFIITVITDDRELDIILAKDKRYYLCSEQNQPFIISVKCLKKTEEVYGLRLFLDGKEVNGIKTLKYKGHFFGFKMGNGVYKKFVFDVPPCHDYARNPDQIKKMNKEFGTIKIQFFKTEEILSKRKKKKSTRYIPYEQSLREEGVKFFERSLSIREGEMFKIDKPRHFFEDYDREKDERFNDYIVDYSYVIDEVFIYYTDFISLQIKGIVI